jgi:hypothetical protein
VGHVEDRDPGPLEASIAAKTRSTSAAASGAVGSSKTTSAPAIDQRPRDLDELALRRPEIPDQRATVDAGTELLGPGSALPAAHLRRRRPNGPASSWVMNTDSVTVK